MRTSVLIALLVSAVPQPRPLGAQRPPIPQLALVEEWRIDAKVHRLQQTGILAVGPDGRLVIAPLYGQGGDEMVAFDSTGKTVLWRIPVGRGDDKDIRFANKIGWTGTTMWVADQGFGQIALVDEKGKVTKSVEQPSLIRPTLGDRNKYPVFGGMEALAYYADGSMLIRPLREKDVFDTPEFDSTATHLLRIGAGGAIQASVARYRPDARVEVRNERGAGVTLDVPIQNRTRWQVSQDGNRIVIVSAGMAGTDSAMIVVVTLNERGDTVYARRYPYTPTLMSQRARDSSLQRVRAAADKTIAQVRKMVLDLTPKFWPPVAGVMIGRDRTTWISLHPGPPDSIPNTRLVLDQRGDIIGTVAPPRGVVVMNADREHVWAVERKGNDVIAVIRYKLVPKK